MPVSLESALSADAPANLSTGFTLSVGGSAQGSIDTPGDSDFLAVDLVAGETYCFALVGIGPSPLIDPILRLYGPDGQSMLALNDNGLVHGNAILSFTATASGRFYLAAEAVGAATGDYALSASIGPKAHFDPQMIAGILDSHATWSEAPGTGAVLSYGFAATSTQGLPGFQPFSEAQKATMRSLLAHFSDCADLTFNEVGCGYSDEAVLLYGNYHDPANSTAATGAAPGDTAFAAAAGDVWVNSATPLAELALPGSIYYRIMLQELARSLGLGNPGFYNTAGDPVPSYDSAAQFWQDSRQFTVMSAFAASDPAGTALPQGIGGSDLQPDTLGLFDILALQQIYGANTATRTGDDTYGFGSNLGGVYAFDQNLDPMLTIWDAGGQDTLDLERYSADQVIDLEAGHHSSVGGYVNNLGIAYGTMIEAAKGGRGDDRLSGNAVANALYGNQGADLISGGVGNDSLYGGAGSDTLIGGLGADVLWGEESLPNQSSPPAFQLVSTAAAGASLSASGVNFYQDQNFTLELIWQQQGLGDAGEMMRFGNLSLVRDASGQLSILFADAAIDGWLPGVLPPALIDGTPHRLSLTYTDMEGRFCLYLDGVKTFERVFLQNTRGLDSTSGILIADHAAIGDIRLFNVERSAADIWQWAWSSLPDPVSSDGLQHNWVGDGSAGLVNLCPSQPDLPGSGATEPATVSFQANFVGNALYGGEGDDLYHVFSSLDSVFELAGQGTDRLMAHQSFALAAGQAVEVLVAANDTSGITLTGNALANRFYSNAAYADTLAGGAGNDRYWINNATDRVIEAANGGYDVLYTTASYTLGATAQVEEMRVQGAVGLKLTGNSAANRLYGGAKADSLWGGLGADRLVGGGGRDLLYGGADSSADLFIFNSPNESSLDSGRDLVYEFVSGRDKIDLHLIDANATAAGNQSFAFAGYSAQAYAVWLVKTTSQLVLRLDVTGDSRADMEIGLVGLTSAQKADFLL